MSFPVITHMPRRRYPPPNLSSQATITLIPQTQLGPTLSSSINSSPSSLPSAKSFTLFPLLPTELQLHIWKLTFTERRVIPIYSAPFTHTSRCALIRFLRPSCGPLNAEVPTKPPLSLKSAPYACKASFETYTRRYGSMVAMRGDGKMVSVKFNPREDVVFFKMGLSSKMHTSVSLEAVVKFQPEAAKCLKRIAVETIGEVKEFVLVLREFESLEKLVVVLPAVNEEQGRVENRTDALGNQDGCDQRAWELGLRIERTESVGDLKKKIGEVVRNELERLRDEKWKEWKLPTMRVVERWEDIL